MNEKGFSFLVKNTNEYGESGVLTKSLLDIISSLQSKNNFLDIGSGFGNLTLLLSKQFSETTIIEPNKVYFDEVMKSGKIKGFNKSWEEVILNDGFDFILASHIFYYLDKKEWVNQINRMLDKVCPNGKLIIVLQSEKSKLYKIPNKFSEKESRLCSEELMLILKANNLNFDSHEIETEIWANSEEEKEILGEFLFDTHKVPFSEDKAKCLWRDKGNKFIVDNIQHIIVCSPKIRNYNEHSVYLESSDVVQSSLKNLMNVIVTKLEFSVLDVGCGDGTFSLELLSEIKKLRTNTNWYALEPEKSAYENFVKKIKEKNLGYIKYENITFQDFFWKNKEKSEEFDFILLSHSFYHFPKDEWSNILSQSRRLLKKGGFIVIILDSRNSSVYGLRKLITNNKIETLEYGYLHFAEDLEEMLKLNGVDFEEFFFFGSKYIKDNENKLNELARYLAFLYRTYPERILLKYKKELNEMLEKNREGDLFKMENLTKLILL